MAPGSPEVEALRGQVKALQEQLKVRTRGREGKQFSVLAAVTPGRGSGCKGGSGACWGGPALLSAPPPHPQQAARDHSAVVALYRRHLLYAIQVSPAWPPPVPGERLVAFGGGPGAPGLLSLCRPVAGSDG